MISSFFVLCLAVQLIMASAQSHLNININDYNVVTLENGTLLLSEDGKICLQNRFDETLCMVEPTNDVLKTLGITVSGDIKDHAEPSEPSISSSSITCQVKYSESLQADGNIANKRGKWSKYSILMLINLRIEHNNDFTSTTQKNDVIWKRISNKMKSNGVDMTHTQCNDKWRYLKGKYTAAKDNKGNRGSGEEPMDFSYFEIMDEFLGKKHNVKPIAVASSIRGDTVPNENIEGFTDALQDSDGDNDVSIETPLETPRKKMKKSRISQRVKQNKTGLCAVWDEMKSSRDDREQNKERRHQCRRINVRNRAIDVFVEKMDQFLEKLNK